ncbi:MAG TPA: hypothetical protein VFZ21_25830 [Gemmatimonadaceae bacterium]|jgi:hypothetical protein|nr:hypothetical protein [Gemmatimonadaceae bacterium]
MKRTRTMLLLGTASLAVSVVSCTDGGAIAPTAAGAGSVAAADAARNDAARDDVAEIAFGRTNTGTVFPAPSGHDRSFHSYDKVVPRTVVIPVGGTVRMTTGVFHQAAIYDVGTTPDDIVVSPGTLDDISVPFPPGLLPDFLINDPTNRLALSPIFFEPTTWTAPAVFDRPGTYLIICTILPHFVEAKMYAYVIVK